MFVLPVKSLYKTEVPFAPAAPVAPLAPVAPVAPVAPFAPAGPGVKVNAWVVPFVSVIYRYKPFALWVIDCMPVAEISGQLCS